MLKKISIMIVFHCSIVGTYDFAVDSTALKQYAAIITHQTKNDPLSHYYVPFVELPYNDQRYNNPITDKWIRKNNKWCVNCKYTLEQGEKNQFLQYVLRSFDEKEAEKTYKNMRTALACMLYIGAHPDMSAEKNTILSRAVFMQDLSLTAYALEKGTNPNKNGVLLHARSVTLAELLIKHGADVNIRNIYRESVLHKCAQRDYPFNLLALYVNKYKVCGNVLDNNDNTPLHSLISSIIKSTCIVYDLDAIMEKTILLMQAGVSPNTSNKKGKVPYKWAQEHGSTSGDIYYYSANYLLAGITKAEDPLCYDWEEIL